MGFCDARRPELGLDAVGDGFHHGEVEVSADNR